MNGRPDEFSHLMHYHMETPLDTSYCEPMSFPKMEKKVFFGDKSIEAPILEQGGITSIKIIEYNFPINHDLIQDCEEY